jgi:uncharacterized protein (DUF433 family)
MPSDSSSIEIAIEDIQACLSYASESLQSEKVYAIPV